MTHHIITLWKDYYSISRANYLDYMWWNIPAPEIVHTVTNISRMFWVYWLISIRYIRVWKRPINAIIVDKPFTSSLSYNITIVQLLHTKHSSSWLYFNLIPIISVFDCNMHECEITINFDVCFSSLRERISPILNQQHTYQCPYCPKVN